LTTKRGIEKSIENNAAMMDLDGTFLVLVTLLEDREEDDKKVPTDYRARKRRASGR
jgi:hypothetical protein